MILALATLFLITKGVQIVAEGKRRMVDPHWQRGLSYLKMGEQAMHWALSRGLEVFTHLALPGGPDPAPLGKRKKKCLTPSRRWKLAGRWFYVLSHKVCQAASH